MIEALLNKADLTSVFLSRGFLWSLRVESGSLHIVSKSAKAIENLHEACQLRFDIDKLVACNLRLQHLE